MRIRNAAQRAFLVIAVALLIAALVAEREAVGEALARLHPGRLTLSALAVAGGLVAQMLSWRALFDDGAGATLPVRAAARVYFVGQLGKYVPGGVWSIVAQAELGRTYGVTRSRSAAVAIGALGVHAVTSVIAGVAGLAGGSTEALTTYWWALLVLPAGVVALSPPVFNRVVALGLRLARRTAEAPRLMGRGLARAGAWAALMWVLFGVHAWLIALDLGARTAGDAATVAGAFALAWLVGVLVVFAPAGAGPREAVLVVALGSVMEPAEALVLAVVSRVMMILADAAAAGITSARRRRTAPPVEA